MRTAGAGGCLLTSPLHDDAANKPEIASGETRAPRIAPPAFFYVYPPPPCNLPPFVTAGWHKASGSDCLPLAAPIGLPPLLILTLRGPERVLVVSRGGGGVAPQTCTIVSQCKSASAPCKNFLWRLWRLVFSVLSGPSDGFPHPRGGGVCKGGSLVKFQ